jgi:sigma-B regulation protein RsbU (phosphoserine phosphatase)
MSNQIPSPVAAAANIPLPKSDIPAVAVLVDDPSAALKSTPVLVVDDSRTMRLALIRSLKALGFENITEAADGRQAVELAQKHPFGLMLLDMEMPEMNGMEVLVAIKGDPQLRGLPVIVISGAEQVDNAVKCIEAGAEDYLPKPFNPTLLRARVTSSIEKQRLRELDRVRLAQLQAEKELLEQTKRRLDKELAEAEIYVRSIFPAPSKSPLPVDWQHQPSTELGGDAFGYHWIDSENFAVYLLDVCGHGVGASLLSVTAINVIRSGSLPNTDFRDPGAVLSALNNAFLMERQNNMYFTLWYGVYHAPTRTLRHASGGHPASLLLTPSTAGGSTSQRLLAPGLIIGAMEDMVYTAQSCQVPPGSQLLVLCDGCYEVADSAGRMLEFDEFERFMQQHGPQPDGLERLFQWLRARHGEGPLDDDFSIVRVQF